VELEQLAGVVRDGSRLSAKSRLALRSAITLFVHARDVVMEMVESKVTRPEDLGWLNHLRYKWSPQEGSDGLVTVCMGATSLKYGYEYLGGATRLVITPLTERVALCLTSAIGRGMGGALIGPWGSGKTATAHDLSQAVAVPVLSQSCSLGFTREVVSKLLGGVMQTGAWLILDGMHVVESKVLSVLGAHFEAIRHAVATDATKVSLDGKRVTLKPGVAILLTRSLQPPGNNPANLKNTLRDPLPPDLAACFRPVALTTPDIELISETWLHAEGFFEPKILARKLSRLASYSEALLSQASHYSWGLRKARQTLALAGSLARLSSEEDRVGISDDSMLREAFTRLVIPTLLPEDAETFQGLLRDIFPGAGDARGTAGSRAAGTSGVPPSAAFASALEECCLRLGLTGGPTGEIWTAKCAQLYQTGLRHRGGIALVGPAGSGKSSALRAVAEAMGMLPPHGVAAHDAGSAGRGGVDLTRICPASLPLPQLYGCRGGVNTKEWTDGVLATCIRRARGGGPELGGGPRLREATSWLVLDGPAEASWMDGCHGLLDETRVLCLGSGERLVMPDSMQVVLETEDLRHASPGAVGRLGVVYFPVEALPWRMLIENFITLRTTPPVATNGPSSVSLPRGFGNPARNAMLVRCQTHMDAALKHLRRAEEVMQGVGIAHHRSEQSLMQSFSSTLSRLVTLGSGPMDQPTVVAVAAAGKDGLNSRRSTLGGLKSRASSLGEQGRRGSKADIASADGQVDGERDSLSCHAPPVWGEVSLEDQVGLVDFYFLASLAWGFGAHLSGPARDGFEAQLRLMMEVSNLVETDIWPAGSIYDQWLDPHRRCFVPWTTSPFVFDPKADFHSHIVPTNETSRAQAFIQASTRRGESVLLTGPPGCGKSILLRQGLTEVPDFTCLGTACTSTTRSECLQSWLLDPLQGLQTKRKGQYFPPEGKIAAVYLDDLHLPDIPEATTEGGDVPAAGGSGWGSGVHEWLREVLTTGGFFPLPGAAAGEASSPTRRVGLHQWCLHAAAPASRPLPSPRLMRRFHTYRMGDTTASGMEIIYGTILTDHFRLSGGGYATSVMRVSPKLAGATVALMEALSHELAATPTRCHHAYGMGSLAQVVQGMMRVKPRSMQREDSLVKLWCHECTRQLHDRLATIDDRRVFIRLITDTLNSHFKGIVDHKLVIPTEEKGEDIAGVCFAEFTKRNPKRPVDGEAAPRARRKSSVTGQRRKSLSGTSAMSAVHLLQALPTQVHVARPSIRPPFAIPSPARPPSSRRPTGYIARWLTRTLPSALRLGIVTCERGSADWEERRRDSGCTFGGCILSLAQCRQCSAVPIVYYSVVQCL